MCLRERQSQRKRERMCNPTQMKCEHIHVKSVSKFSSVTLPNVTLPKVKQNRNPEVFFKHPPKTTTTTTQFITVRLTVVSIALTEP